MTTTIFFVRHVPHILQNETLVGRTPDVPLPPESEALLPGLGLRLAKEPLRAVYCSPLTRTRLTAEAVAAPQGLTPIVDDGLLEIDFGSWTGKRFSELHADPAWVAFCHSKALTQPPGGEPMTAVQARVTASVERIRRQWTDAHVAIVSHGDPIKAALCHYLGLALDFVTRFEIAPGSVSAAAIGDWGAKILLLNEEPAGPTGA